MPGNGLSFAIRVRCQINVPAMVCFLLECLDNVFLVLGIDVFRLEIIIDINAKCLLRQISQMTFRSKDLVIRSENFLYCFCFSRRFYDNKMLSLGIWFTFKRWFSRSLCSCLAFASYCDCSCNWQNLPPLT